MKRLVGSMIVSGRLYTQRIIDAFEHVDRKYFVPSSHSRYIYIDAPLSIGKGQTISQPSVVAFMLEYLQPKEGDRVLGISSGSGWTTALLCRIMGEKGSVIGLERVDDLVGQGKRNLSKLYLGEQCRIQKAEERIGCPDKKFDKILVSASANDIPKELFKQLNIGGTLLLPVKNSIYKFTKYSEIDIGTEELYGFLFVPLIY